MTVLNQIGILSSHLTTKRKWQLVAVGLLSILASAAEVVSIGALIPFLAAVASPDKVYTHDLVTPVLKVIQVTDPRDILFVFTLFFVTAAITAGLLRVLLLWAQSQTARTIGADLSLQAYSNVLRQPYSLHVARHSSEILIGIQKSNNLVGSIIQPAIVIFSSTVMLFAVVITLLLVHPIIALVTLFGLALIYTIFIAIINRRVATNSVVIATQQQRTSKAIQESLGSIRDILIDGTQRIYLKIYKDAFIPLQSALASNQVIAGIPRFGVEALGMALIAIIAYKMTYANDSSGEVNLILPILGALGLGVQRLLPLFQQIYSAYIAINGSKKSAEDALKLLQLRASVFASNREQIPKPVVFQKVIALKELGFRYAEQGPWILRNISLEIPKGSRVGFVGVTGSGKSTLLDLFMGLLTPTEGNISVDDISITTRNLRLWQAHISHVPQAIFLADAGIAENIALGVPLDKIDFQRVQEVAQQAQMAETIKSWPRGFRTLVGERGVRLSGGQRQRIGIARALYKRSSVLIFDEATSALDNETEASIMQILETLGREITILIVAHRLTTLKNCDQIVELSRGRLKNIGNYEHLQQETTSLLRTVDNN